MFRYRFTEASVNKAKRFLSGKVKKGPSFATRFKEDLTVKNGKLFYKDQQVVPKEKVAEAIRKEMYGIESDTPAGRDSAFHVLKRKFIGVSRRDVMAFIRGQRVLTETKTAVAKPKVSGGEKLKGPTFECDLIFVKRKDLMEAQPRFIKNEPPELSYVLSCTEKTSGLSNFVHVKVKEAEVVSPLVIKQCQKLAKKLKLKMKDCILRSDAGGEFANLKDAFKKHKIVKLGSSIEQKNQRFQQAFFRALRQRRARTINGAIKNAERTMANTLSTIQGKTPTEVAEQQTPDETLKKYNDKRRDYKQGDNRGELKVGDRVRLLIKSQKPGIGYKTYKNQTWSARVYKITRKTKTAKPPKYYVNKKWVIIDSIVKAAEVDLESEILIENRDNQADREEDTGIKKKLKKNKTRNQVNRREAAIDAREKLLHAQQAENKIERQLDAVEIDEDLTVKERKEAVKALRAKKVKVQRKKIVAFLEKHGKPVGGTFVQLKNRAAVLNKELMKRNRVTVV